MTGNLLFARIARRSLVKGPSTSALLGYGTTFLSRFGLFQPFKVLNPSSKLTTLELSLISLPLAPSQNFSFRLLLPFLFNSASEHLYEKRALQVNTLHYNSQCDPLFWLRSKIEINSVQAAHFSYSRGSGEMEKSICGRTAESIEREKSCCTLRLLLHASKCTTSVVQGGNSGCKVILYSASAAIQSGNAGPMKLMPKLKSPPRRGSGSTI